jgi:transposase
MEVPMGNYLKMADKQRILALVELYWSYRQIQRETGVDRETVARYDPRREPKPAKVPTGSQSACEPYRQIIEASVAKGLSAQRIWQDLKGGYHFSHGYDSVKRFARRLKRRRPEVAAVMEHPPGGEAQIDFFQGSVTLDPESGKCRPYENARTSIGHPL